MANFSYNLGGKQGLKTRISDIQVNVQCLITQMTTKLWSLLKENENEFITQHVSKSQKEGGSYNQVEYGIHCKSDVNILFLLTYPTSGL